MHHYYVCVIAHLRYHLHTKSGIFRFQNEPESQDAFDRETNLLAPKRVFANYWVTSIHLYTQSVASTKMEEPLLWIVAFLNVQLLKKYQLLVNTNCSSTGILCAGAAISRQQEHKRTLVTTKVWISEHATQQTLIFLFIPLHREEMTTRFSTTRAPSASPFTPRRTRPGSAGRSSSMTPHLNADALGFWCGCPDVVELLISVTTDFIHVFNTPALEANDLIRFAQQTTFVCT